MRLRESLEFGAAVAWGLAAAHAKGIVHRDVKPANLFITKDGRIKILDFGLARFSRPLPSGTDEPTALSEQTDAGIILGTVGYMPPEQVRGEATDSRTDIFALGAVLYETLTARQAFDRPTPAETMSTILNDDPPSSVETSQQMPAPGDATRLCIRIPEWRLGIGPRGRTPRGFETSLRRPTRHRCQPGAIYGRQVAEDDRHPSWSFVFRG